MIKRGDVVVVDFPFTDVTASKVRPALVGLQTSLFPAFQGFPGFPRFATNL